MINGISAAPIPQRLKYAEPIQAVCQAKNFFPCLAYAIAWRETISGEVTGSWKANSVIAPDYGYGLFQLTYPLVKPWPPNNWEDPATNAAFALDHYLIPAYQFFTSRGIFGNPLVLCIAAGFNEGVQTAWTYHLLGNVDIGTTNGYASAVLANYQRLIAGKDPA